MTGVWTPPRRWRRPANLVAVNAVLVLVLAGVTIVGHGQASAQPGTNRLARPRGHYTALSPRSAVGDTGALAIFDSINEEMTSLEWDKTRRSLVVRGYRDLTADSTEVIGR